MLRSLVVRVMGRNGHPHAIEEAKKQFKSHCAGGEQIPADLRAPVYQTVLAHGDEATFEEMLKVTLAVFELLASATTTARFPCHYAMKYRMSLGTHLATVVAIAVAANSDMASSRHKEEK